MSTSFREFSPPSPLHTTSSDSEVEVLYYNHSSGLALSRKLYVSELDRSKSFALPLDSKGLSLYSTNIRFR